MNVKTHSIKFDANSKLLDFVQGKMDKLEKFFDRIVDAEVFLRLNNEGIENKTVEVKLNLPGEQFFAESTARSFEKAMENCFNVLKRKLKEHKDKLIAH